MYTDTHTHIYMPDEFDSPDAEVRSALAGGVGRMVLPNVDGATVAPMLELCRLHPGVCFPALGLHPTELGDEPHATIDVMEQQLHHGGFVAVGEVGMDLYWDKSREREQMDAFERQLNIAAELSLPVIIHCRDAMAQTLEVIEGVTSKPTLLFHCFGGTRHDIDAIRRLDAEAWFGIGGVATFKNSGLRELLPEISIEKMVLETDSPYLAPVPYRGKKNTSAYIPIIAAQVAKTLGVETKEVEERTTQNAEQIFRFSDCKEVKSL